MKISAFFTHSIDFEEPFHLDKSVQFCYDVSNFFFSPVRYFFNGQRVICSTSLNSLDASQLVFTKIEDLQEEFSVLKTAVSIMLLVPGILIGGIMKSVAVLASEPLKNCYRKIMHELDSEIDDVPNTSVLSEEITLLDSENESLIVNQTRIEKILQYLKDTQPVELLNFLKELKDQHGCLPSCIRDFSKTHGRHPILCDLHFDIGGTNQGLEQQEDLNSLNYTLGCFLMLYAEDFIPASQFFEKMNYLTSYTAPSNPDPIQAHICFDKTLADNVRAVEIYLKKKDFFEEVPVAQNVREDLSEIGTEMEDLSLLKKYKNPFSQKTDFFD